MVFQPIVNLHDRHIVGYEALARFPQVDAPHEVLDSNNLGIGPHLWFAAAGVEGLLAELETLAMKTALGHLKDIPVTSYLSVNAAVLTLVNPVFLDELKKFDLSRVVVEITEHDEASAKDYEHLHKILQPLRHQGAAVSLRIAVDDLGAGASIEHVLAVNADIVKLDISLIRDVDTSLPRRAMVYGMTKFSVMTGALVVAEGVETESEVAALEELGVQFGQGFLFGKPEDLPVMQ